MTVDDFKKRMARYLTCKLECIVTQNRTSMLRLLEKNRHRARLSMHEMFVQAPEEILVAIAAYVNQIKKGRKEHQRRLREYIHTEYDHYSYKRPKVVSQGKYYDLQSIMKSLNESYFEGKLQLDIGWFKGGKPKRRILFGKYEQGISLVRLNDCLDDPSIPDYFVRFVVYHEMVHAVVPGYLDAKGHMRVHGPAFKERERAFLEYSQARQWEKENKERFFGRT